jgi:proline racemase
MSDVKEIIENTDAQRPSESASEKSALERSEKNGQGFINIGGTFNGHYSKCSVKEFMGFDGPIDKAINGFFEVNRGFLVVDVKYGGSNALVFYTKTLDDRETHVLTKYAQALEDKVREELAAEEAEEEKRLQAEELKKDAERQLIELGRRCQENHGAVIEENRKLKKGK